MTLILAARNSEGVLFCYDTASYHTGLFERVEYVHKVRGLETGNAAVGLSGAIADIDAVLADFNSALQSGQTTEEIMGRLSARSPRIPKGFIIARYDGGRFHLRGNSVCAAEIADECLGLGSGMFPEVGMLLLRKYDPQMDTTTLRHHLEKTHQLSRELSAQRDVHPIKGFGLSRLTPSCYEILDFSTR